MTEASQQKRIAYVTDLAPRVSGGGSYAVNWHAFDQLKRRFDARYMGPLTPRPAAVETALSRFNRKILQRPGSFAYFSPATLDANARMAEAAIGHGNDGIVFRTSARWCRCRVDVPYFVYLDIVFHTFFHNTFNSADFQRSDIERIWREEAAFLEGADAVFFESAWGLGRAREAYGLKGAHYYPAGHGGAIEPPARDRWTPVSRSLLTVAMNFRQKGGDIVLEAYKLLKPQFPALTWHIVGGPPDSEALGVDGITHEGVLDPNHAVEGARLRDLLATAFVLVHPTREDANPLVLTEAAYFGCPAMSVNAFAIPELVLNGETGILLEPSPTAQAVADAIAQLLSDDARYREMRRRTREFALKHFSWDTIGDFMNDTIDSALHESSQTAHSRTPTCE